MAAYDYQQRVEKIQAAFADTEIEALLVTQPENVRYLSGLVGHSDFDVALLLTSNTIYVLTNDLYREAFFPQVESLGFVLRTGRLTKEIEELAQVHTLKTIGFDPRHVSVSILERLVAIDATIKWEKSTDLVEYSRLIKDSDELEALTEACRLTDLALQTLLPEIRPGMTERAIAQRLLPIVWSIGGDGFSFDPIIAIGENASKPHHIPGESVVRRESIIQFDIGVRKGGYGGDLSRVAVFGNLSKQDQHVVDMVLAAQQQAIDSVVEGMDGRELDRTTKTFINQQDLPPYTHGLGHGLGLDVHEAPTLHQDSPEASLLKEGMVFTIEPGIYLPNRTGVRIEDVVSITSSSVICLSHFPREVIQL